MWSLRSIIVFSLHWPLVVGFLSLKTVRVKSYQPTLIRSWSASCLKCSTNEITATYDNSTLPVSAMNPMASNDDEFEDMILKRALKFLETARSSSRNSNDTNEQCFLVGLDETFKSTKTNNSESLFTMEESLTELIELSATAGLTVVGSTHQKIQHPHEHSKYCIGSGKVIELERILNRLGCKCVIFDTELTPSQQKNLEIALNKMDAGQLRSKDKDFKPIKVIDRTALILDIFAQHARTREGQLQVSKN